MSGGAGGIGWAVLGTANIARAAFLPALGEAGGRAVVVGSRLGQAAQAFASANGVDHAVEGYAAAIEHPGVDAVYVPLPNSLHARWAAMALDAGKAVLCEKPLCTSTAQAGELADSARRSGGLLWEAFVFPYHPQMRRVEELVSSGAIGELREVSGSFHFRLGPSPGNIRHQAALGGGCLADVGCYPIRLAQLLFAAEPMSARAEATFDLGVEVDTGAVLAYPGGRRLSLTCGFRRAADTTTRLLGEEGVITLSNPYHPRPSDQLVLQRPSADAVVERPTTDRYSFSEAVRHISAVVRGEAAPLHLATDDSVATARALELVAASL